MCTHTTCIYYILRWGLVFLTHTHTQTRTHKGEDEAACNKFKNCEDCVKGDNGTDSVVDCYWCSKPTNSSGPKCRHFSFNSAIPVDGVECENLMYNVASCRSKSDSKVSHTHTHTHTHTLSLSLPSLAPSPPLCAVNALVIVILIVLGCLVFVVIICCVCCCCCFFCAKRKQRYTHTILP